MYTPQRVIENFETFQLQVSKNTLWRLLCLTSEDGVEGWAEFTIAAPHDEIEQRIGQVAARFESLRGKKSCSDNFGDLLADWRVGTALASAVDQAFWDLDARTAQLPLAQHIRAQTLDTEKTTQPMTQVGLYANINRGIRERSPEGFAAQAIAALKSGHKAIKIAPFDGLTPARCDSTEGRTLIRAGLERVSAVSQVLGAQAELRVDCHWRFDEETAVALVEPLAERGVKWFECPIEEHVANVASLARIKEVANLSEMQLVGCETMSQWSMFAPYVENAAYDVIMPDVKYLGRLQDLVQIVHRADALGAGVALHNPTGPVAHLASVHATAALTPESRLEFQYDESPLFSESVVDGLPSTDGGETTYPNSPGIGRLPDRSVWCKDG